MQDDHNLNSDSSDELSKAILCPLPREKEVIYLWSADKVQIMVYWWEGNLVAHSAMCPHMGSQLTLNRETGKVQCPWHALRADPSDLVFNHPRFRSVRRYRTKVMGEKVHLIELLPRKESAL